MLNKNLLKRLKEKKESLIEKKDQFVINFYKGIKETGDRITNTYELYQYIIAATVRTPILRKLYNAELKDELKRNANLLISEDVFDKDLLKNSEKIVYSNILELAGL
jgi:hypothetical protein